MEAALTSNPVAVSWSSEELATQIASKKRGFAGTIPESLRKIFEKKEPNQKPDAIVLDPCHVVDCKGKVLLFHLPGFLRTDQEDYLCQAVMNLEKAAKSPFVTKKEGHWRALEKYFQKATALGVPVGVASFSPSWFSSGHPVRTFEPSAEAVHGTYSPTQAPAFRPKPSATIRAEDGSDGGMQFVCAMRDIFALMGAALSIIHPKQYQIGVTAWKAMEEQVEVKAAGGFSNLMTQVLEAWASPFTVAQVVSNRESPIHCDTQGFPTWYDGLLTFGRYEKASFKTPSLGMEFAYHSGTAIFLTSHFVEHGVARVAGDRACIASFMRPEVMRYALELEVLEGFDIPTQVSIRKHFLMGQGLEAI
jgi:hypothetical protein